MMRLQLAIILKIYSLLFQDVHITPADEASVPHLFALNTSSREFIVTMMCFDAGTLAELLSIGKSRWRDISGGAERFHSWAPPYEPLCREGCYGSYCSSWFQRMDISPTTQVLKFLSGGILHILLCSEPLCKSNLTSTLPQIWLLSLISALINGSVFWLSRKKRELICLFRLSKYLWVRDKNTWEAMHLEMMKPHIPLVGPGSNLIWIASLAAPLLKRPSHLSLLSPSSLFNSVTSKLEKETTAVSFANYSRFAVNYFLLTWIKTIWNTKQNLLPELTQLWAQHKIFE